MINIKTLKQRINLLQYIEKTLKSVESININKRAVLKKQNQVFLEIKHIFPHIKSLVKIQNKPKALLIIASDSSLCGSYNNSIIKYFKYNTVGHGYEKIYIIGKKIKKLKIDGYDGEYHNYKDFFKNHMDILFDKYEFNMDILGYHSKNIEYLNLMDVLKNVKYDAINDDFIIEGPVPIIGKYILFEYLLMSIIGNIEQQENNQRLMFLKNSIENCESEINENVKKYRSLRQENITREINELIATRCN